MIEWVDRNHPLQWHIDLHYVQCQYKFVEKKFMSLC